MSDLGKLFENAPEYATEIVAWGNNLTWANETMMYSLLREGWVERDSGWNTIATRPQPRKTVEDAKSEPEWTHTTTSGHVCKVVVTEPDSDGCICVLREDIGYDVVGASDIKPIKSTITKAEAWDRCIEEFGVRDIKYVMQDLMDEFDITN